MVAVENQCLVGKGGHRDGHEGIDGLVAGKGVGGFDVVAPGDGHALRFGAPLEGSAEKVDGAAFKAEVALNVLSFGFPVGEEERGMSAHLEIEGGGGGGVVHAEVGTECAARERIGHFEVIGPGEDGQLFGRVFNGKGDAVACGCISGFGNARPFALAHKPMFGDVIDLAVDTAGTVPHTADDGEEDGSASVPKSRVALPAVFLSGLAIGERLKFGTLGRECGL